ncbi:hypothetical protein EG328_008815 [Venturia inaequalis]|uniref:Uncharacterized protein n=1 Tax=Venturia inaequalis TaxID=5025 RepID=A0A8H3UAW1_VENIN|nr:hypothetical protein EG328_008815 [Venturia inaequalis]
MTDNRLKSSTDNRLKSSTNNGISTGRNILTQDDRTKYTERRRPHKSTSHRLEAASFNRATFIAHAKEIGGYAGVLAVLGLVTAHAIPYPKSTLYTDAPSSSTPSPSTRLTPSGPLSCGSPSSGLLTPDPFPSGPLSGSLPSLSPSSGSVKSESPPLQRSVKIVLAATSPRAPFSLYTALFMTVASGLIAE